MRIAENRRVQPRERPHREASLVKAAAGDLIALLGADDVLKHEREPALSVDRGEPAARQPLPDPLGELLVERDLARVGAHALPGGAARRIL